MINTRNLILMIDNAGRADCGKPRAATKTACPETIIKEDPKKRHNRNLTVVTLLFFVGVGPLKI